MYAHLIMPIVNRQTLINLSVQNVRTILEIVATYCHKCKSHYFQICTNTPGSYNCTCNAGFTLRRDNRSCKRNAAHSSTNPSSAAVSNTSQYSAAHHAQEEITAYKGTSSASIPTSKKCSNDCKGYIFYLVQIIFLFCTLS